MNAAQQAAALCAAKGHDFATELAYFAAHGWAIVTPDCVLFAEPWDADTVFVWLYVGEGGLPLLCALAPAGTRWVRWARGLRVDGEPNVKQYAFQRVRALCSASTLLLHGRKKETTRGPGGGGPTCSSPDDVPIQHRGSGPGGTAPGDAA